MAEDPSQRLSSRRWRGSTGSKKHPTYATEDHSLTFAARIRAANVRERWQRSGQPCIRGLRVTDWDVLDMLASGMTEGDILNDYPYLEKADFPAVYSYASQAGRERRLR